MAATGSSHNTKDHQTFDLQQRQSESLGRTNSTHPLNVNISGSSENENENEVGPSRLSRNGSIGKASSIGASLRRRLSGRSQLDEDIESERVSEAGDIGDRALSTIGSRKESSRFSIEQGVVFPNELIESYDIWSHDHSQLDPVEKQEEKKKLPPSLEYIACLVYLAVFGMLGVLTRFLLQKLFGPGVVGLTSDQNVLYLDLPSNIVGSFLMGWFGVVFKDNISHLSDQLAIGLSTGYLGSLTTFSGWNQKMLGLSVHGRWVLALLGFLIGLYLTVFNIFLGVETAKVFRTKTGSSISKWRLNNFRLHLIVLLVLVLMWGGLWVTSGILEKKEFQNGGGGAQLWLACLVGPFGVWIRWWLARLNGRGLGKAGLWKWIPFGTLIANVSAACVMAALATVKAAVNTKNCDTIATGIQFGLMGCLSTVSTFMAEVYAMTQSSHPWRACAYAGITIGTSFVLGTLIYSVPVWTRGYN